MPVCQYFGQLNCTAPVFGGNAAPSSSDTTGLAPHLSLFDRYFGTNRIEQLLNLVLYYIVLRYIIWPLIIIPILNWLDFRRQPHAKTVLLELTPPIINTKSTEATHELYRVVHSLCSIQSYEDHLLHRKQLISLEIVSSRPGGIRFLARVPAGMADSFKQAVTSYLPEVQLKSAKDYLPESMTKPTGDNQYTATNEYKQTRAFVYPLRSQEALARHDPISYITGTMAKPEAGELFAIQLVLSSYRSRRAMRIRNKLINDKEPRLLELSPRSILLLLAQGITLIFSAVSGVIDVILTVPDNHGL